MPKTAQEIAQLYHHRQRERGPVLTRCEEVRRAYNGDMVIPLPELDQSEKSGVVNLLMQGVDQMGMRVASTLPGIMFPPLKPGADVSQVKARNREQAVKGWWQMNQMQLILRERARFLIAYATSPVTLSPVSNKVLDKRKMPFWRARNPLSAYLPMPETKTDMEPIDAIFCQTQSRAWLEERYPTQMRQLAVGETGPNDYFEVLEYMDATEMVLVVVGKDPTESNQEKDAYGNIVSKGMGSPAEILNRTDNRAGIPLIVSPGRIVLDRLVGMFDALPDLMMKQGKLDSLEYVSIKRSIFPDQWAITHPGSNTQVRIDQPATGMRGQVGQITGGAIDAITLAPSPLVAQAIDRAERDMRVTGGLPSQFGGENPTNVRTARAGNAVVSSTVTMPIGEMQDIFAVSLECEDVRGIALMKGWYGKKQFSFMQSRTGRQPEQKDYSIEEDFETDMHVVKYSIPGTDAASLPIELGQRVGTGEISLQTSREIDPLVTDPIREARQVLSEGLEKAMLSGLEQQAAQGAMSPVTIVKIQQAILGKGYPKLATAVVTIHEEMQKGQAQQQGPTAPPGGQPGMTPPGAPPPAAPTAGPQGPGGAIPPPNPNQANLSSILQTLRRPANQGPAEQALG